MCRDNELSPPSLADPLDGRGRRHGRIHFFDCEICDGLHTVPATVKQGLDQYLIPKRG